MLCGFDFVTVKTLFFAALFDIQVSNGVSLEKHCIAGRRRIHVRTALCRGHNLCICMCFCNVLKLNTQKGYCDLSDHLHVFQLKNHCTDFDYIFIRVTSRKLHGSFDVHEN
jgi:hypothetical protein